MRIYLESPKTFKQMASSYFSTGLWFKATAKARRISCVEYACKSIFKAVDIFTKRLTGQKVKAVYIDGWCVYNTTIKKMKQVKTITDQTRFESNLPPLLEVLVALS